MEGASPLLQVGLSLPPPSMPDLGRDPQDLGVEMAQLALWIAPS
jgi:hypothetical protein